MIIIGAGMAGLLTAHMLRRYGVEVWEAQHQLPDNHGALLRFRTNVVAEATGIPFKRVSVQKAVLWRGRLWQDLCPLDAQNAYAGKVTGHARGRSIADLKPGDRYIAPDTFLVDLAKSIDIRYNRRLTSVYEMTGTPWISTIPMPAAMALAGWEHGPATFPHRPVWTVRRGLGPSVELYQTIYYPDSDLPYYRASLTGSLLTIEYMNPPDDAESDVCAVVDHFGLSGLLGPGATDHPVTKYQEYGKLLPIDERARRMFIVNATSTYNMYSVGRFATWRQILLDDVVHDVRQVAAMIEDRTPYLRTLRNLS